MHALPSLPALRRVAVALSLLAAGAASAVPPWVSGEDTDNDATIRLFVRNQTIAPDVRSECRIELEVGSSDVGWSSGDSIKVWLYENDVVGDELLWSTELTVGSGDLVNGRFTRTFDCGSDFGTDGFGDNLELYAEAEVIKDDCGTFCLQDRPETGELDSLVVADDPREDDDAIASGSAITAGRTNDLIGVDADHLRFPTTGVTRIAASVLHAPGAGRLNLQVLDAGGSALSATVTEGADRTTAIVEAVAAGTYALRVTAADGANPNFYDVDLGLSPVATECSPGATETDECGDCGTDTRTCTALGAWGAWGGCMNEGECTPGEVEEASCGPGLVHQRSCTESCAWTGFSVCEPAPCTAGQTVACYSGAPGTQGVGECAGGTRSCVDGVFGPCVGEVVPIVEDCANGTDDDCDGIDDRRDPECDSGLARLGEACTRDDDCDPRWICLGDPDPERFVDGYCGDDADCTGAANECTSEGVCADLGDSDYCLAACGGSIGCRFGYTCAELPEGEACVPRCQGDEDCFDPDLPACDLGSGLCEAGDPGDTDRPGDTDDDLPTLRSCGCASAPSAPAGLVGLGLGLFLVAGRRRR